MIWHTMCLVYYSNKLRTGCSKYKPECQLFKSIQAGTDVLNKYINSPISDDKSDLLCAHPFSSSEVLVFYYYYLYKSNYRAKMKYLCYTVDVDVGIGFVPLRRQLLS